MIRKCWFFACLIALIPGLAKAQSDADALAKTVLAKAGVHATVCEMPRVGDGALAAALARAGVAQVHGLAPDAQSADAARKPAVGAGLLGSQVLIEPGSAAALPLGDRVADLVVVADAADANLKDLSAAEMARVLSPYRGTAVVGNAGGAKSGLTKAALEAWAKTTTATVTVSEDGGGLWAVLRMPALKGGDDWSHFFHGPDANPVSNDTAFVGANYQLQSFDYPIHGGRNYTIVASAGRLFVAHNTTDSGAPPQLVASGIYNARVLWRRPLPENFGDLGSLVVATPDRLYLKDGAGVLVLDPETGAELQRLEATKAPQEVQWLAVSDGLLLTVSATPETKPKRPAPAGAPAVEGADEPSAPAPKELVAWDATTGKEVWRFPTTDFDLRKLAVSTGRVFLFVNASDAVALDLRSGKKIWTTAVPPSTQQKKPKVPVDGPKLPQATATASAYYISDNPARLCALLDAADGHQIWRMPEEQIVNQWVVPNVPMILQDAVVQLGISPHTGQKASGGRSFASGSCGHSTAMEAGLWIGYGVTDTKTGKQLAPNMAKSPCGTGSFVADGAEVLFPNVCYCRGWHGLMLFTPAGPEKAAPGARLEKEKDAPAAAASAAAKGDASDWPMYRADETRRGSSAAALPTGGAARWTYTPPRPADGKSPLDLPECLAADRFGTQAVAVGDRIWMGTADGAVVCLDRQSGTPQWTVWTAGRIDAAPVWSDGRVYAGSDDGWLYCLDGATGALCWRYRVAPAERRICVMGRLSSSWPVQSVLLHDGVVYASARVMGQLDGSTLCALDARTGAERWSRVYRNDGATYANGKMKNEAPTAYGSQLAWYGSKLWWQGVEFGPAVVDPATGDLKRAVDESYTGDDNSTYYDLSGTWNLLRGKDIGILPGGWVALGNELMHGSCGQTDHMFLRSGPNGVAPGAENAPQMLTVNLQKDFYVNREIPVWDAEAVLTRSNASANGGPPVLYRGFAEALNQAGDAHSVKAVANLKMTPGSDALVQAVALSLPDDQQSPVLPDALWQEIAGHKLSRYGAMLLAKNAVVLTVHGPGKDVKDTMVGRMPNTGDWRAIAVSRTDRSVLFDVRLPDAPAPSGMSLTRAGDVLVPLVDGSVVCIGEAVK